MPCEIRQGSLQSILRCDLPCEFFGCSGQLAVSSLPPVVKSSSRAIPTASTVKRGLVQTTCLRACAPAIHVGSFAPALQVATGRRAGENKDWDATLEETRSHCVQTWLMGHDLLLFFFTRLASWTALEAMDQPSPPWPALFLRLMLIVQPSRLRKLFSHLWVTHPITTPLQH